MKRALISLLLVLTSLSAWGDTCAMPEGGLLVMGYQPDAGWQIYKTTGGKSWSTIKTRFEPRMFASHSRTGQVAYIGIDGDVYLRAKSGRENRIILVSDGNGNFGVQITYGGGGDTPGAAVTVNGEATNAETIYNLEGPGGQTGVDGGEGIIGEGGAMFGEGFSGGYGGIGLGVGTPVGASGYVTHTHTLIGANWKDIAEFLDDINPFGDGGCQ